MSIKYSADLLGKQGKEAVLFLAKFPTKEEQDEFLKIRQENFINSHRLKRMSRQMSGQMNRLKAKTPESHNGKSNSGRFKRSFV